MTIKVPKGLVLPLECNADPRSEFELPVVIQAKIAPMNLVKVGAFTGVYGGRLGHSEIGRYCSIAPDVDIASDQHPTDWLSSSMIQYVNNVHGWANYLKGVGQDYISPSGIFDSNSAAVIGNDVWIGQNVFIKSGVKIGDGAVVAAHSVVVKDVPEFSIVAGVPAKIIKMRFSEKIIERIKSIRWWEFNLTAIDNIDFKDVSASLDRIESLVCDGALSRYIGTKVVLSELKN